MVYKNGSRAIILHASASPGKQTLAHSNLQSINGSFAGEGRDPDTTVLPIVTTY